MSQMEDPHGEVAFALLVKRPLAVFRTIRVSVEVLILLIFY
jgi:hypothetical protein